MGKCDEITLKGAFGLDQYDWGNNEIWAIWKLNPCCGGPDLMGALKCIVHWWFCAPCSFAHLYGSSNGAGCSIAPHCLFAWFCGPCAIVATRYNLRKGKGVPGNIIGDIVCGWFCGPCSMCQMLRASSVSDWALWPIPSVTVVSPSMQLIK